jgi:hypothetical protein
MNEAAFVFRRAIGFFLMVTGSCNLAISCFVEAASISMREPI